MQLCGSRQNSCKLGYKSDSSRLHTATLPLYTAILALCPALYCLDRKKCLVLMPQGLQRASLSSLARQQAAVKEWSLNSRTAGFRSQLYAVQLYSCTLYAVRCTLYRSQLTIPLTLSFLAILPQSQHLHKLGLTALTLS